MEAKPRYLLLIAWWEWRARRDSNPRPQPPQGCALSKLSYERAISDYNHRRQNTGVPLPFLVPKVGLEPTRPCGHYALNVARLPFRHFGALPPSLCFERRWTQASDPSPVKHSTT